MLNDSNEKPGKVETSFGLWTMGHEVEVGLVIGSVSGLCSGGRRNEGGWGRSKSFWNSSVVMGEIFVACWSSVGLVCVF